MPECLDETAVLQLFPLHFEVDRELRLTRASPRLSELVPAARPGVSSTEAFEWLRPRGAPSFEALQVMVGLLSVVRDPRSGLMLRGQLARSAGDARLLFVGGPQVSDTAGIVAAGLKLTDFAAHDARLDLLVMMAGKQAALRDAERLAGELREAHRKAAARAERLEDEIVQQERVASLGRVVAGIAHEINTPLGVAVTAGTLAQEAVRSLDELVKAGRLKRSDLDRLMVDAGEALETQQLNLRRAAELVRQFKEVAVDQAGAARRQIELGAYVEESLIALRPMLRHSPVRPRVEAPVPVSLVTVPGAVSQIVTNLVHNALIHAFSPGHAGNVVLRTAQEGNDVLLEVSDDGRGMTAEEAAHAFEPFFTTRRGQGGSGLGLSVVHNLVINALRGTIALETSPGAGTTFRIRIPSSAREEAAA